MKKKGLARVLSLLLVGSLVLSGCTKKGTNPQDKGDQPSGPVKIDLPYPAKLEKDGATVGGTLNIGLVADSPFEGIFNTFLYENSADADLFAPTNGIFMKSGPDQEIAEGGYCNVEFDKANKTATYKINKDLTWSDGVPVTSDDLIFVYESIGSKDYLGVRYDEDYMNVVGMEDYHAGKATSISGLKKIDDKTLEVTFKSFYPGILWGAGLTYNAEPKHYLKDIPLKDMVSNPKVRVKPLSCGPFMVSNIVPGESVEYVPNPYWFGEKPKVDKIVYKRTSPDTVVEALKAGTFDVIDKISVNDYLEYKDLSNISLVSEVDMSYDYLGFKFGKFDTAKGEVVVDPSKKMSDVKLRQAIAYAMDTKQTGEQFYNGLRIRANALMDPLHARFWNANQEGYPYDPEKAKKILDEAGYKDTDNDGMREDPKGNKLKINFLARSGGEIAEPLSQFYIQCWNDVGLDVQLQNGRLVENNAFYDMIGADDKDIDMYLAGWGVGSNPDPSGLYGRKAQFNYPRFATEENDKLLAAIASDKAFKEDGGVDYDYLIKAYQDWEKYMCDQVVVAPTHYRVRLTALNNRVTYWDLSTVSDWGWEKVGLLSATPEKAK